MAITWSTPVHQNRKYASTTKKENENIPRSDERQFDPTSNRISSIGHRTIKSNRGNSHENNIENGDGKQFKSTSKRMRKMIQLKFNLSAELEAYRRGSNPTLNIFVRRPKKSLKKATLRVAYKSSLKLKLLNVFQKPLKFPSSLG